ncbi:MAG: IclR family transcriptional regulator [Lachnospiraceae bacterium]|nr:IclR family transcriptional regulator [Lachnospiraceae bacterium]
MEEKNPIQSAERIFKILELLADKGDMGLLELSQELNLNKSTVHRMLSSLIYMGYAKQNEDTQKYSLSFKLVTLAGQLLERTNILPIARPYLEELSLLSGETVHLVQREGNHILYIDKVESTTGSIRMVSHVGMVHPMYCSGVGKAIMSTMTEEEIIQIWNESIIEKKTEHTITDFEEFKEVLANIRKQGYALDNEENELGVRCIAACIYDYHKNVKYAFSISGPTNRMTTEHVEQLSQDVLAVQKKLSSALGYRYNK